MKRFLCLLTLMPLCLALPAGCGSPGRKWRDTDEIDDCGTAVRNGKETDVASCTIRRLCIPIPTTAGIHKDGS